MRRWLCAVLIVVLLGWLWTSGRLELLWLSLIGLGGAGSAKLAKDYAEKKKAVDVASEEMKTTIGNARVVLEKHKREVEEHEKSIPSDDRALIAGANERERRRNPAVPGRADGAGPGGDVPGKGG